MRSILPKTPLQTKVWMKNSRSTKLYRPNVFINNNKATFSFEMKEKKDRRAKNLWLTARSQEPKAPLVAGLPTSTTRQTRRPVGLLHPKTLCLETSRFFSPQHRTRRLSFWQSQLRIPVPSIMTPKTRLKHFRSRNWLKSNSVPSSATTKWSRSCTANLLTILCCSVWLAWKRLHRNFKRLS